MRATESQRSIEYLVVEYARDVSIQTLVSNTTQETVSYYLRLQLPQVCVVSVGLMDAMMDPPVTQATFVLNMDRFLGLLRRTCGKVVWVSLPAIVEDESLPRMSNCKLRDWNVAILELLEKRHYDNVYTLDIWDKSLDSDHVSFLGLTEKFYGSLARLIVAVMMGQGNEEEDRRSLRFGK
jgi:hypothetical protein